MTKVFIQLLFLIVITYTALPAQEQLPVGTNPPAIEFKHFPNPIYALVWRNWNLVEPARIYAPAACTICFARF